MTRLIFGLILVATSTLGHAAANIADFTRKPEFSNAQISPDGNYLAVSRRVDDRIGLIVLDLADMSVVGVISGTEEEQVRRFGWVNDEQLVLQMTFLSEANSGLRTYGEIYIANYDGSATYTVYGFRAGGHRIGSLPSRGDDANMEFARILDLWETRDEEIVIASTPPYGHNLRFADPRRSRVLQFNVNSREVSNEVRAPFGGCALGVDEGGTVRFCSGYNAEYEYESHYYVDWETGWVPLPIPEIRMVRMEDDSNEALVLARPADRDRIGLYRFDAVERSLALIFEHERYDLLAEGLLVGPMGIPFGIEIGGQHDEYFYFDELIKGAAVPARWHRSLRETFKGQRVRFTSATHDGRRLVVHIGSATNPGEFYLFDTTDSALGFLFRARDWLPPERLAPVRAERFETSDGLELDVFVTSPAIATEDEARPLVVLPHGGPHLRDVLDFDQEVQLLAHAGYTVLQVNFRGSRGYGEAFETAAYGEWGGKVQRDIAEATRWAINAGIAAEGNICIYGGSFGAYSAIMNAIEYPELYECAAAMSGFYDFSVQMRSSDTSGSRTGRSYLRRSFDNDTELAEQQSPINQIHRLEKPVFIAHGGRDLRTPIAHARRLRKALKAQGVDHEWLTRRNEAHGFYFEDNVNDFYERLLQFLDEHLDH